MSNKLGSIELGGELGGYEIVNQPADKLPQDLASAFGIINENILGATYDPIWYVGKQLVNGMNYLFLCKEIRATKDQKVMYVGLVINIPPGEGSIRGEGAKIVKVIEYAEMPTEAKIAFEQATRIVGVSYRPVIYVGQQVVKGINYYYICEAQVIYPGAEPYPVLMVVNSFQGVSSIVSVNVIKPSSENAPTLCGYSFNW